jgi:phospholipase, patatin family
MVASSALPPYFSPIKIGGAIYCDGGLLNNFPIEPLKGKCDILIGSFVNPLKEVNEKELGNPIKFLQRIYNVVMDGSYEKKFKKCDYVFLHELDNIGVLETKFIDKAFDYGYEKTLSHIALIKSLVEN